MSNEENNNSFSIPKFKGDNFSMWMRDMKAMLIGKDLYDAVFYPKVELIEIEQGEEKIISFKIKEEPKNEDTITTSTKGKEKEGEQGSSTLKQQDKLAKIYKKQNKAFSAVYLALDPSIKTRVIDCNTAKEILAKLESEFTAKTFDRLLRLLETLVETKLAEGGDLYAHIAKMELLFKDVSSIKRQLDPEEKAGHLLASLPPSYSFIKTAIRAINHEVNNQFSYERVVSMLLSEYEKNKPKPPHHPLTTQALTHHPQLNTQPKVF
eukprot:TRINITY_DN3090_c0_g2_i2.p1 TRINITY_DN3090_c0_g2~~TRINITY_DN3090_c0_g2_i2.p1  ORF type:complete len:265 (+),score=70.15 TRINITY_DN3090_c0_g2_i2:203-997(+)